MNTAIEPKSSFPVGKVAVAGTLAVIVLGVFVLISQYFSYANTAVDYETKIDATVSSNKIEYNRFTRTIVDSLGVANQYKKALTDVINSGLQGRYAGKGVGGSLSTAIHEAYPTISETNYQTVIRQIEAGRMNFADEQNKLVDQVQRYKAFSKKPWTGMWLKYAGYPTLDLTKPEYNPIVSTQTKESFDSGEDSFSIPNN